MAKTLVRTFDKFADAENARNALLRSGFPAESVHLESQQDEAGPVEGNFVLEYKDADHERDASFLDALTGRDDPNEGQPRSEVVWRGNFLLTVDASDIEQFDRATRITGQFGTTGPEPRSGSRKGER